VPRVSTYPGGKCPGDNGAGPSGPWLPYVLGSGSTGSGGGRSMPPGGIGPIDPTGAGGMAARCGIGGECAEMPLDMAGGPGGWIGERGGGPRCPVCIRGAAGGGSGGGGGGGPPFGLRW
jgi:hypothetical protein